MTICWQCAATAHNVCQPVDRDLTPHPQYAAFYKWLQQDYKADAVVHFGMHGTVEWLPGAPLGEPIVCGSKLSLTALSANSTYK